MSPIECLAATCHIERVPQRHRRFVYLLVCKNVVVYVGQTNNVGSRLALHRSDGMPFDYAFYREVPASEVARYEGAIARALLPALCRSVPFYRGNDNAALIEFGLEPHADEARYVERAEALLRQRQSYCRTPHRLGVTLSPSEKRSDKKRVVRNQLYRAALRALAAAGTLPPQVIAL